MTLLRSILFLVWIYGLMVLMGIIYLPLVLLGGRGVAVEGTKRWSRYALFGLRHICGIRHEVRGRENLPAGPVLIASKHQAMWETLFFMTMLEDPSIVLKKELLSLPVYGWYAKKIDMISIDRSKGAAALKHMVAQAQRHRDAGRPLVIFPEGTRTEPGAAPDYKPGIAALYTKLDLPCVPVALNSGLCWQGKGILRRSGTIIVEFLPPIPPGLKRKEFMAELEARIETATQSLIGEAKPAETEAVAA